MKGTSLVSLALDQPCLVFRLAGSARQTGPIVEGCISGIKITIVIIGDAEVSDNIQLPKSFKHGEFPVGSIPSNPARFRPWDLSAFSNYQVT